jgi:stress-induced-phosphoprotein 1
LASSSAIEHYTSAINIDGTNHLLYSNRSAAYLSKGDAQNALDDANACLGLNPNFSKGFSRKGAALHSLKRYNDAITTFKDGLSKFPDDKVLKNGLDNVEREKDGPPTSVSDSLGMSNLFGPDMMAKIALDPKTRVYMNDPDFMAKIQLLQKNPDKLGSMIKDPRIMDVFKVMLGMNGMDFGTDRDFKAKDDEDKLNNASELLSETGSRLAEKSNNISDTDIKKGSKEDLTNLTSEELVKRENDKESIKYKEKGNQCYKEKKFDEALSAYDKAISLNPTNMTLLSNKAAVYFTTKKYDDCITTCQMAVKIGKENRASFEERARAFSRCAKAYQKKGDLVNAIEMCKNAQLESYDKATERMLKMFELDKKKADALAYQDETKAEEAKQQGNTYFRNKEWPQAVEAYEEAVKRAPKNATIRNNLAAALCKIMDFNGAKREIEVALEQDPKYVKAWTRKGDIEVLMKENHKAMASYKNGLQFEPENIACKEGLRKVTAMVNFGNANMSEEEKKERAAHAMADPEIQAILQDPVINQILKECKENPSAASNAMTDTTVRSKLEKLIAAGVLQVA